MKKYLSLIVFITLALLASSLQAQMTRFKIEADQIGRYYLLEDSSKETAITIDRNALDYIKKVGLAVERPGENIIVAEKQSLVRYAPVFKKIIHYDRQALNYNSETKNVSLRPLLAQKEHASYLLLYFLASFLVMIIADVLPNKYSLTSFFLSLLASLVLLLGVVLVSHNYFILVLLAYMASLISIIYDWWGSRLKFKISRLLYYLLLILFLIFYFH